MKKVYALPIILGAILLISFQNCSQGNFQSSSNPAVDTAASDSKPQQFEIGVRIQEVRDQGRPLPCPAIMCAAPPPNCHYEQEAQSSGSARRCNLSCGKLVCGDDSKPVCDVAIRCQAPAVGCRVLENSIQRDANGCQTGCGEIVCAPVAQPPVAAPPEGPKVCPMYRCEVPPEGCHIEAQGNAVDQDGCQIGCGRVVCDAVEINPTNVLPIRRKPPVICPEYVCAVPNQILGSKCEYSTGSAPVDENGCQSGCGIVACSPLETQ